MLLDESWNEPRAEIYPFATHGVSRACLAKLRNWPGNIASLISGAPRETCDLLRNSHALHVHLQHVWVVRLQEKVSSCTDWEGFMVSVVATLRFGTIQTIEYDPYRNARICLVKYEAGMNFVSGFNFSTNTNWWLCKLIFYTSQFTFFWCGGERMINIPWSRINTDHD